MLLCALIAAIFLAANSVSAEPIDNKPLDPPRESINESFVILDPKITLEITRPGTLATRTIEAALYIETKRDRVVMIVSPDHDVEQIFQKFSAPVVLSRTEDSLIIVFEETGQRELERALAMIGMRVLSSKNIDH